MKDKIAKLQQALLTRADYDQEIENIFKELYFAAEHLEEIEEKVWWPLGIRNFLPVDVYLETIDDHYISRAIVADDILDIVNDNYDGYELWERLLDIELYIKKVLGGH